MLAVASTAARCGDEPAALATLAPEEVVVLQAYVDGVNVWLDRAEAEGPACPSFVCIRTEGAPPT